jgi:hypothetical protein
MGWSCSLDRERRDVCRVLVGKPFAEHPLYRAEEKAWLITFTWILGRWDVRLSSIGEVLRSNPGRNIGYLQGHFSLAPTDKLERDRDLTGYAFPN